MQSHLPPVSSLHTACKQLETDNNPNLPCFSLRARRYGCHERLVPWAATSASAEAASRTAAIWRTAALSAAVEHETPSCATQSITSTSTSVQYESTRTLYIGGLPWHVDSDVIAAALRPLCNGATHVEVASLSSAPSRTAYPPGSKHRGYMLAAFRSAQQAAAAAMAVSAASAAGWEVQGNRSALLVGPAEVIPASWPPHLTRTDAELQAAAQQAAAAAQHTAHLKRRRQRAKQQHADSVAALLESLPPPGGRGVARAYVPLLQGLAAQLAGSGSSGEAVLHCILSSCSPPLLAAIRSDSLQRHVELSNSIRTVSAGPIILAPDTPLADVEAALVLDWSQLPAACDPAAGGGLGGSRGSQPAGAAPVLNSRALRKRVQVESFALALLQLLQPWRPQQRAPLEVVDFGCGTGNLVVPLAVLFPNCSFTAVDMKQAALQRLRARVQSLGLSNVQVHQGRIEEYAARADVVLALHACGAASDHALLRATKQRAAFIVSPCCIGKLNSSDATGNEGTNHVPRPRSQWMVQALEPMHAEGPAPPTLAAAYAALARAADFSHHEGHGYVELAALAKANLELDRCIAAGDSYHTALTRLLQPQLTAKSDVLIGAPAERCQKHDCDFRWPWHL